MRGVKKQNLPSKPCIVCGRPFAWRKKWEKVWEDVKFCSDRCRKNKGSALLVRIEPNGKNALTGILDGLGGPN